MANKAKQPYQYEPLITPSSWRDDEQRFSIRLTQIIDDLYQKYGYLNNKTVTVTPPVTEEPPEEEPKVEQWPVGSIYISRNSTNPAELFGGTWEQIKDMFLLAAGDTYSAGETGGEAAHTLAVTEIPSHRHSVFQAASGTAGNAVANKSTAAKTVVRTYDPASMWFASGNADIGKAAWTIEVLETGGSQAHNNMPPYLVVYAWERVA